MNDLMNDFSGNLLSHMETEIHILLHRNNREKRYTRAVLGWFRDSGKRVKTALSNKRNVGEYLKSLESNTYLV